MRLREREMPLDPEVERELAAIEAGLSGLEVEPRLEQTADLARQLRAEGSAPEPGFAARLDERVAEGFPREDRFAGLRARLAGVPPRRLLAPAGAAVTLLVAVGVGISQLGGTSGGGPQATPAAAPSQGAPAPGGAGPGGTGGQLDQVLKRATPQIAPEARAAGAPALGFTSRSSGSVGHVPLNQRKVAQKVDVALATSPERFRDAADGVFDVVRDHRGFVVSSSVSGGDPGAPHSQLGHATFDLRIPAGQLEATLGSLSDLGHVVSRTDGTRDITYRFVSAKKRIAALDKARQGLLSQLANAVTIAEQESIKRRLAIVEGQLSAAQGDLGKARQRVHQVPLSMTIDADRALAGSGGNGGGFGIGEALHDAGKVLIVMAGITLISAAVLLPLGALALLAWSTRRAVLRRQRDKALDAATS